jgi:hypothetical protein
MAVLAEKKWEQGQSKIIALPNGVESSLTMARANALKHLPLLHAVRQSDGKLLRETLH